MLPAEGRLLVGYCDDLATPRVLGPLRDLIGSVGTALTRALERGDRGEVFEALRAELDWADAPDGPGGRGRALGRRGDAGRAAVPGPPGIAALPLVLVLTYRDDELAPDHPLRQLLGLASGRRGCAGCGWPG